MEGLFSVINFTVAVAVVIVCGAFPSLVDMPLPFIVTMFFPNICESNLCFVVRQTALLV